MALVVSTATTDPNPNRKIFQLTQYFTVSHYCELNSNSARFPESCDYPL